MDLNLETIATAIATVVAVASAISNMVPSVGKVMAFIDFLALNWNKARNDPQAQ